MRKNKLIAVSSTTSGNDPSKLPQISNSLSEVCMVELKTTNTYIFRTKSKEYVLPDARLINTQFNRVIRGNMFCLG